MPSTPKMAKATGPVSHSTSGRKYCDTAQLVTHKLKPAMPMPKPRTWAGTSPEMSNEVAGDTAACCEAIKVAMKKSETMAKKTEPLAKEYAPSRINSEMILPARPMSNSRLRPMRSTTMMPTMQAITETTPITMEV